MLRRDIYDLNAAGLQRQRRVECGTEQPSRAKTKALLFSRGSATRVRLLAPSFSHYLRYAPSLRFILKAIFNTSSDRALTWYGCKKKIRNSKQSIKTNSKKLNFRDLYKFRLTFEQRKIRFGKVRRIPEKLAVPNCPNLTYRVYIFVFGVIGVRDTINFHILEQEII